MTTGQHEVPPHAQLIQMGVAHFQSRIIHAAASLGLADHLANGPKTAEELAEMTGTNEGALYRLMRTLGGLGVLLEDGQRRFSLTPLGEALQTDAPGSARASILTLAGDWSHKAWDKLLHSVETGETAIDKALGMPIFEFLAQNPDQASLFSETMVGFHGAEPPAVAAAYDFSSFDTVVDVGGATGNLLATILQHHDKPKGVLADLPHVLEDAPALLQARGVANRVTIEAHDFFESVPANGDAYVLSHIIHDWDENRCLKILENCRNRMHEESSLLIVEMVLPDGNEPHMGKMLDIGMLVFSGGQERTAQEYGELLDKAGFELSRIVPTESDASIVEARVA